jgi:hypothetical protein
LNPIMPGSCVASWAITGVAITVASTAAGPSHFNLVIGSSIFDVLKQRRGRQRRSFPLFKPA